MEALKHQARLWAVLRSAPPLLLQSLLRDHVQWLPAYSQSSDAVADNRSSGSSQAGDTTGGPAEVALRLRWLRTVTYVTPAQLSLRQQASICLPLQTLAQSCTFNDHIVLLCQVVETISPIQYG